MSALRPAFAFALACFVSPLLGGCDNSPDTPVAGESEEAFDGIRAGKWDVRSRLTSMEVARDDADSAERVDALMREERAAEMCLDYSERSKPPVRFLYAGAEECSFTSFSMVGGRINGTMACAGDGPEPTRMTGSYDKASFTVTVSKQVPADEGRTSERSFSTSGRHRGNC